MADQRIDQLNAETTPAAADVLPIYSIAGSDTKKITVKNLVQQGAALVDDASIPVAKVNLSGISGTNLTAGTVAASKLDTSTIPATGGVTVSSSNLQLVAPTSPIVRNAGTGSLEHANSGVTAGTYTKLTVDSKGHITAGATLTSADVPAMSATGVAAGTYTKVTVNTEGRVTSATTLVDADIPSPTTTAGTYTKVVVDAKGRVTSGTTLTDADVPALANSGITAGTYTKLTVDVKGRATAGTTLVPADLPIAVAGTVGAMSPGTGLSVTGGGVVNHTNSVTAGTTSGITFDAQGHITATTALVGGDLPVATSGVIGGVRPGTGLTVDGSGIINVSAATNAALGGVIVGSDFGVTTGTISLATQGGLTAGTYTKATFNAKGIATGGSALTAADIPNLSATQITTGTFDVARIGANTVTGEKLANYAITKIGDTQPTADQIGQFFFNPLSRDLFLWDGNVFQPIGISVGEIVFAGTFDASAGGGTGHVASVTAEGTAIGLVEGSPLPAAATANNRYYLVVSEGGTITSGNAPNVALAPPDIVLSTGIEWTEVDVSQTFTSVSAAQVAFTPEGTIAANNVQAAIEEVNNEKLGLAGGTVTGNLEIGTAGSLSFEGATANAFETTLTVVDPTADRTITLPDTTGTVVTTGDTGTVTSTMLLDGTILDADVNASAAIAYSKLATLTSGNIVLGSSANVATSTAVTGDVTISNLGVTAIASGVIVDADINASAAIVDTKLATIATAGKVSNSATTAASANTASAIVARDASGNFTAGTITAALTGTASGNLISGGALGTPSSGTLTNCTGLPISGLTASTSTALGVGSIELGDASDTTLSRSAAGVLAVEGVVIPSISSTSTLTNKTLTDPAIIGTILEDVFTITDGAAFEVDPGNGSIQLITLGASRTPLATNFAAGESVTLMVDDGTAYTLTWTDSTWGSGGVTWVGGSAPTLATSGYSVIQFWKVSTKVYGAYVGDVA